MARTKLTDAEKEKRKAQKAKRFTDLAQKRVTLACEKIRLIGNLSGPNYNHTANQVSQIVSALENAIAYVQTRFEEPHPQEKEVFEFQDDTEYETEIHTD